jgi:hypothetical protein
MSGEKIEVFFSYSHKDEKLRERLETHLSALRRENVIAGWHDRKIMPGSEWKNQIDEHLKTASIILLLISADFLNSDYCWDAEMKLALARHDSGDARVIPIILRPCDWAETDFGRLQAMPRNGKPESDFETRDHAFNEIARGIRAVVKELSKATHHDSPPARAEAGKPGRDVLVKSLSGGLKTGVAISKDAADKLERMRFINAVIKSDEEAMDDEEMFAEYRELLGEMVNIFLPLVRKMVKAGLLTLNINIEDIGDLARYSTLSGEPTFVFDNGNIWIDTEFAGGNLRREAADTLIENLAAEKEAGSALRSPVNPGRPVLERADFSTVGLGDSELKAPGLEAPVGFAFFIRNSEERYETCAQNLTASLTLRSVAGREFHIDSAPWFHNRSGISPGRYFCAGTSLSMSEIAGIVCAVRRDAHFYTALYANDTTVSEGQRIACGEWDLDLKIEGDNIQEQFKGKLRFSPNGSVAFGPVD